jgi:sorting nexin-29
LYQLFVDFKKAYDSVRKEVLYNILTDFGISVKLIRLIEMRLKEVCSKFRIGKNVSDAIPIQKC